MYRILSASKDTYITNKIINNRFRATDANVGQAGTLDLFKLYNESISASNPTSKPIELSRLLLKFDLSSITLLQNQGRMDVADNSFNATLKLHDVYGGQTTPNNFNVVVFPLTKDFDEGHGFDIVNFSDLGETNWITASYTNGAVVGWTQTGARASGSLSNANSIDVIVSGTVTGQSSEISLCSEQKFITGEEDLFVDVTNFVSASVKGLIPNNGFLVALSGSHEKDDKSYFVKRFASRNSANTSIRPKLIIKFDDSLIDNHSDFTYDHTGSLYLSNMVRNQLTNIVSGAAATEVQGENCMLLKIQTGSIFSQVMTASQALVGSSRRTGVYSSSFAISSFDDLYDHIQTSGSIVFDEIWSSFDETVTYLSASLTVKKSDTSALDFNQTKYNVVTLNLADRYKVNEEARIRVFVETNSRPVAFVKSPIEKKSEIFTNMHYRVRDFISGEIIIPFDKNDNSTKLSADSNGMYYDFSMSNLPKGRTFIFDYLIVVNGFDNVIMDAAAKFVVE